MTPWTLTIERVSRVVAAYRWTLTHDLSHEKLHGDHFYTSITEAEEAGRFVESCLRDAYKETP